MGVFPNVSSAQFQNGIDVQGTAKLSVVRKNPVDLAIVTGAVAVDLSRSSLLRLMLDGAAAIAAPSGAYEGMEGRMVFTQDATGGRDVTWDAAWEWGPAGRPDFDNDAAGAVTVIDYQVIADDQVLVTAMRGTGASAQDESFEDLAVVSLTASGAVAAATLAASGAATVGTTLAVTGAATAASVNGVEILSGTVDPTAGAGVAHTLHALYFRNNGGTLTVWYATAAGATAWAAFDPLD